MNSKKITLTKTQLQLLCVLLPLLSLLSIVLPFLFKFIINRKLKRVKNYPGHIDSIVLSGLGKTLVVRGFYLDKADSEKKQTRFISAETIILHIDRTALWKGFYCGQLQINKPLFSYLRTGAPGESNSLSNFGFKTATPAVLVKAEVTNGVLEYIDTTCSPVVELQLTELQISATNLSNIPNPEVQLPTEVIISGRALGGDLHVIAKADLSQQEPTFDLNAELKRMNLVQMNNFFKAYGNFDVNKGTLGLFTEVAAKEGKFTGYLKPVILDLDVVGSEDYNKGFMDKVWQTLVGVVAEVFQNQKEEELATKIPFSGTFKTPRTSAWYAIAEILYNAFVKALTPSIDYEININSVKKKKQ